MSLVPVFDLGGVLIDWDPEHLYTRLIPDPVRRDWFLREVCSPAWNRAQDAGRSFADGVADLVARFPAEAALVRAYDERWLEMVRGVDAGVIALLETMRSRGHPLYSITNFSREKFAVARRTWPFLGWFDGIVVSADEGVTKPDPAIFHRFCDRFRIAPGACLFIDDQEPNVAAARAVGMRAERFTSAAALRPVLADGGLV